jgi:two-component system KDP operon response regulator KdpE
VEQPDLYDRSVLIIEDSPGGRGLVQRVLERAGGEVKGAQGMKKSDMNGRKVLIIEDDPRMLGLVERIFERAGAEVYTAAGGREGVRQFLLRRPDLVILDVMMPGMDGWEVAGRIRHLSDIPILFLTALDQQGDIARGYECGAADYVTKPFSVSVLLARAEAIVRRRPPGDTSAPRWRIYDDGYLTIDPDRRVVLVQGKRIDLTHTEYEVLAYLYDHAGRALTLKQILQHVWGWEYGERVGYVQVYVSRLRKKLERDPRKPVYLLTERGVGYRFEKQAC